MSVQIVQVAAASDGTGSTPPRTDTNPYVRNDEHFKEKLATAYMKDQGLAVPGVSYRLDRLPTGYSGWEKSRPNSKHVDRYLHGHPKGIYRSLVEVMPHFTLLQSTGSTDGCDCFLCGGKKKREPKSGTGRIGSPASSTRVKPTGEKRPRLVSGDPTPSRNRQSDYDGIPDIYRTLLDTVLDAAPHSTGYENIVDKLSPDWRAGHEMLQSLFNEWAQQPSYLPRVGELVLFTRTLSVDDAIVWETASKTFRRIDRVSQTWLDRPRWEVGVVTQIPVESVFAEDLDGKSNKMQNVAYSGFRVEPLSLPGSTHKTLTSQHKYVPLHAIRPLTCWQDCVKDLGMSACPPTLLHALAVASTFCVVGKYAFKGTWPDATVFSRGLYIGAELVMTGDTVRLMPSSGDTSNDSVTDLMVVSSIRLRFVNLDEASNDDYDQTRPYNVCLHVAGRAYTLDPKCSFHGTGQEPVTFTEGDGLPSKFAEYGTWYHVLDPANARARLEVPFTRILGRCHEYTAMKSWFVVPEDSPSLPAFKAVNTVSPSNGAMNPTLSHGLQAVQQARSYSTGHDQRIDRKNKKSWYWAESRIEQLDLHEVNGQFVGPKDEMRNKKQINAWRQALKVLDGKRGGLEDYHAARKLRGEEKLGESSNVASGAYGRMASAVQCLDSGTEAERAGGNGDEDDGEGADMMEVDSSRGTSDHAGKEAAGRGASNSDVVFID